jgi:membrane protein insertase Oxa1/YidC/SpoIIIJ
MALPSRQRCAANRLARALCYLVLPVALVVSQAYSQKVLQPPNPDPSAAQANAVLKFMPLLIGYFSLNVPSGLGIYWFTNNLFSTLQTMFIRQRFNAQNPPRDDDDDSIDVNASEPAFKSKVLDQADGFNAPAPSTGSKKTSSSGGKTKRRKRR